MLSQELESLYDWLSQYQSTGLHELTHRDIENVCAILKAASQDARQLESIPVKICGQTDPVPRSVIRLAQNLNRKGVKVGMGNSA